MALQGVVRKLHHISLAGMSAVYTLHQFQAVILLQGAHRPRRQFSASGMTHIMLAFEFGGGWKDIKGSVAVTALQFLLGGGGSFSAGGPGASGPHNAPHAGSCQLGKDVE